jgi:hypothetical protein
MSRCTGFLALTAAGLLLLGGQAFAVTNGQPDGSGHPSVGHVYGTTADDRPTTGCSGVMIAEDVFLTSGACTDMFREALAPSGFITQVWVTFDPNTPAEINFNPDESVGVDETQMFTNPLYPGDNGQPGGDDSNVGVMILDLTQVGSEVVLPDPATLPVAGRLDMLDPGQLYTMVAFGFPTGENILSMKRNFADAVLILLHPNDVRLRMVHAGTGPIPCVGTQTEAGPAFVGATDEIVALIIDGGYGCEPVGLHQRLDIDNVRSFLAGFVTLP